MMAVDARQCGRIFGVSNKIVSRLTVSVLALVAIATIFGLVFYLIPPPHKPPPRIPPSTYAVSANLAGRGIPTQLAVGTNIQSAADITPSTALRAQTALDLLTNWKSPMVRLHLGFRQAGTNDPIVLPESVQGNWDFTLLDATIQHLRDHNITFFLDVRTAPPWMFDANGQLPDAEFSAFATYMARLVGWYNKGGFTDDKGKFHASGHTGWVHVWEIWNEPKSGWDIPGNVKNRAAAPWMTPDRYANLYDVTEAAMKAVDPTILTGGPAINSYPDIPYLLTFIKDVQAPLDFFSMHFYAANSYTEPDTSVFNAVYGPRFLQRLIAVHKMLQQYKPGQNIPIWVDELNFDEASTFPIDLRGTSPVSYPFIASAYVTAQYQGVALLDEFTLTSDAQFGLIDITTNQSYRPYWLYRLLAQEFPPGSTLLPVTVDARSGNVALAAIAPDGQSLRLLVANLTAAHATDVSGAGVTRTIPIALTGTYQGRHLDTSQNSVMVWNFDATTPAQGLPTATTTSLGLAEDGSAHLIESVKGYGVQLLSIPLAGGSAMPLSTPSPAPHFAVAFPAVLPEPLNW